MAKTLIILMFPWQFIPLAKDIVTLFAAMATSVVEIQLGQESVVSAMGPSIKYVSTFEGGGVSGMLTFADMGGGI